MIPEGGETSNASPQKDNVMLAGYQECANEALTWLLNLGYEPGHPLIRSLAAHLTKKQAYLEKLSLERFLIEETLKNSGEGLDDDEESDPDIVDSAYELFALQIKNNQEIQKALVDAVFKGCDLQYCNDSP